MSKIIERNEVDPESLKKSLELCRKVTQDIIDQLEALKEEIVKHRRNVLVAKTSGTSVTTLGTALAVTGLIMAPFTLGASLIVSSVGAATSISGAATNLITDLVDRSKKKKHINNIQELSKEQQEAKDDLALDIEQFAEIFETLIQKGLTNSQAIYATIQGDRCAIYEGNEHENKCHEEDFEWVDCPDGKWKPIRKFCFKAGFGSLKVIKNSKTLATIAASGKDIATLSGFSGGGTIFNAGTRAATTGATTSSVASGVGRFLGSSVFRGTMAAVGVVFTTIDIALLVKQWKQTDPSEETIQVVIDEFTDDIKQYEDFLEELEKCRTCKMFVGWLKSSKKNIPIVGVSPFPVETLLKTFTGQENDTQQLYREVYPEFEDIIPNDHSRFAEFILQDDNLLGGSLSREDLQDFMDFTTTKSEYNDANNSTDDKTTQKSLEEIQNDENDSKSDKPNLERAEIVTKITQVFTKTSSNVQQIHVFDLKVLKLNQIIIQACLEQMKLPSFEDIRGKLQQTSILHDFDHSLPQGMLNLVRDVVVAYNKYEGGYLNANKWEYNLILELLKSHAASYFAEEFEKYTSNIKDDDDEDFKKESKLLEPISDLIEILINHKCFIDPVAAAIWNQKDDRGELYQSLVDTVSDMFRNLKFRIPVWALEVQSVISN